MKTDIKDRADIEQLVAIFYGKIKEDASISYFFNEVAKVNWDEHLPKMCDFFENILFFSGNYDGNPMVAHEDLHKKSEVKGEHFNHWNALFDATVDELFEGKKAEEIKQRSVNIAAAMMQKAHR
ncbi:hemoglobin-like protein [Flavobacterium alvei]|uniref:Hemoglobin-like protein n=1 Tax=Flavobacterium alvei TaxID=2080416 RepID=A0A2S5A7Y5_9FLAO|nr:group III truncated hemoglobin [Flavobacterium alvei]POY38203.1 hemoglobin-like protein [Flavobacterium alvei]